jgi:23S rRNA (adenine2503-C2)-methyltransferase
MTTRYAIGRDDLGALVEEWVERPFRAQQVWEGLYAQRKPLEDLSNLSQAMRQRLAAALPLALSEVARQDGDKGTTTKWLWEVAGGHQIETVLMRYRERATVCVSSQAGCAMACSFCATGQAGFDRHLDAGEIIEQVARAQHASPQRVSNVVFMGMGEPLANLDAVWTATERIHADFGL